MERLNKVEAKYGEEQKMKNFMQSNLVKVDCPDIVVEMAPMKDDNEQQLLKTPENSKRGRKRGKSTGFEKSVIRKIDFTNSSISRNNDNPMWENYPDLAELKENKSTSGLAEIDFEVFIKHRGQANEGARIVKTEAGAYLACAASITNPRLCHPHKLTTKKCRQ